MQYSALQSIEELKVIMKAVIEIAPRGSVFKTARKQLKAAESRPGFGADYHLSFESARALFSELTPARIDLLEALRRLLETQPRSKATPRNSSTASLRDSGS